MDVATRIEVGCAVTAVVVGILQLIAAVVSLRAAWNIARVQERRAFEAEQSRRTDFQNVLLSLVLEATRTIALESLQIPNGVEPSAVLPRIRDITRRLASAARAVLPTVPANAKLAVAGIQALEALEYDPIRMAFERASVQASLNERLEVLGAAERELRDAL